MPNQPTSSFVDDTGSSLGQALTDILSSDEILPGSEPSYQLCKSIYLFHPLGAKIADRPITLAQSQERELSVGVDPTGELVEAFREEWDAIGADRTILNLYTQARVYGLASLGAGTDGVDPQEEVDVATLSDQTLFFNVWDPLNTSGLIVNQDPNSPLFQRHGDVRVSGKRWHRSRTLTVMNEESIYIAWTGSAFAYAGRSAYQRAFFPLKSFLHTMITDQMVAVKAGVLVTKMEQAGSITDRVAKALWGVKRGIVKQAQTGNVISVGTTEDVMSLNLQNVNNAMTVSRDNIIKNVASGVPMPAKLLTDEAFVLGFGEGTQDAAHIAQYLKGKRVEMRPAYEFFDRFVMRRAWSKDKWRALNRAHPGAFPDDYESAFYAWKNSFKAVWPNPLEEPESDRVEVDEVKLKAVVAAVQVFAPLLDPANKVKLIQWALDQFSSLELLFSGGALNLDLDELERHLEEQRDQQDELSAEGGEAPPKPFSARDAATVVTNFESLLRSRRR